MSMKHSAARLQGVPETLLIPLYARAVETQRPDAICHDPLAVMMMARIDYDFSKFADATATLVGIAARTAILDELTQAFMAWHPQALIVNIAAGLDARFFRMDNGQIHWIELDLPEAIDLRRAFFSETERYRFISSDALHLAWLQELPRGMPTLFIIEGLLMYLVEADVQRLIGALADGCPGATILAEVMGRSQAERTEQNEMVSKTQARFRWGIRHAAAMAEWHPALRYITDISIYDRHEARWLALPLHWPAPPAALRNTVDRIVQLEVHA